LACFLRYHDPENIERFTEDQAISPSYDLATTPPPPFPSSASKLDQRHTWRLKKGDNFLTGEKGTVGEGREAKSNEDAYVWFSIKYKSFNTLW
jgi:hypothetical protein